MKKLLTVFLLFLTGCAEVTAIRATIDNPSPKGLPFYGHKPILVVSGQSAKIEIIPNLNERYALRMNAFLAKNDVHATLNTNGTLSNVKADMDTTGVISLLEKALDKIPIAPAASASLKTQGEVSVYEFVFHSDGTLSLEPLTFSKMSFNPKVVTLKDTVTSTNQEGGSVKPVEVQ